MPKICAICRKSDMLCQGCNKLLEDKKITRTDVELTRALEKLGMDVEFSRTLDYPARIIIIAGKDSGRIIGRQGRTALQLSKLLGKEIDIIEEGDEKKMIEKMLRVPTLGINKVYGQEEKLRIRVERRFRLRIKTDSSLISKVLSKPVEIIFE
jgi:transcription antitermination factor NusA-like protein